VQDLQRWYARHFKISPERHQNYRLGPPLHRRFNPQTSKAVYNLASRFRKYEIRCRRVRTASNYLILATIATRQSCIQGHHLRFSAPQAILPCRIPNPVLNLNRYRTLHKVESARITRIITGCSQLKLWKVLGLTSTLGSWNKMTMSNFFEHGDPFFLDVRSKIRFLSVYDKRSTALRVLDTWNLRPGVTRMQSTEDLCRVSLI
jgi:hypothetical protein